MTDERPMVRLTGVAKRFTKGKETISMSRSSIAIPGGVIRRNPSSAGQKRAAGLPRRHRPRRRRRDRGSGPAHRRPLRRTCRLARRHIGFVFQFYNLMPMLTAAANVELPLLLTRLNRKERVERVQMALSVVGLAAAQAPRVKCPADSSSAWRLPAPSSPISILLVRRAHRRSRPPSPPMTSCRSLQLLGRRQAIVMVTHDPTAADYAARPACRQGPDGRRVLRRERFRPGPKKPVRRNCARA